MLGRLPIQNITAKKIHFHPTGFPGNNYIPASFGRKKWFSKVQLNLFKSNLYYSNLSLLRTNSKSLLIFLIEKLLRKQATGVYTEICVLSILLSWKIVSILGFIVLGSWKIAYVLKIIFLVPRKRMCVLKVFFFGFWKKNMCSRIFSMHLEK